MLKRNGEYTKHTVPGVVFRLTDRELESFNAAFETIESDFLEMKQVREELNLLEKVNWEKPAPKAFDTIMTPEGEWNAHAQLITLPKSEILLCRRADGDEWAVIQRFPKNSVYAQAHGDTDIVLKGNDVRQLMTEYMAQVQHTLRFMARNLEAKAQKVAWEQFPDNDPSRVVRAISERCSHVADNTEVVRLFQSLRHSARQSRGIGI